MPIPMSTTFNQGYVTWPKAAADQGMTFLQIMVVLVAMAHHQDGTDLPTDLRIGNNHLMTDQCDEDPHLAARGGHLMAHHDLEDPPAAVPTGQAVLVSPPARLITAA